MIQTYFIGMASNFEAKNVSEFINHLVKEARMRDRTIFGFYNEILLLAKPKIENQERLLLQKFYVRKHKHDLTPGSWFQQDIFG